MTESRPDRRVVQCNYRDGTGAVPSGARAYLIFAAGDAERVELLARSRSGRWIRTWAPHRNLRDFRFKAIPGRHPLYGREEIHDAISEKELAWIRRCNEEGAS